MGSCLLSEYVLLACHFKCNRDKCPIKDDCNDGVKIVKGRFYIGRYDLLGRTVFITREEAEAKLKEMEKNNAE